jgi:hypothetical protein
MKYIYVAIFFLSCNKIVDIPTSNSFLQLKDIESNDDLLNSYVNSIYHDLYFLLNNDENTAPYKNLSFFIGSLSDEFNSNVELDDAIIRNGYYNNYYESNFNDYLVPDLFVLYYKTIINCNNAISILEKKEQSKFGRVLLEVRAIRSIVYYILTQIYSDIPLIISSDYNDNVKVAKSPRKEIINFCVKELLEVYSLIDNKKVSFNFSSTNHSYTQRINKDVVSYYLSILYIIIEKYDFSINHSLELINNYLFSSSYEKKFELNSSENIWILSPSMPTASSNFNNASASTLNYRLVPSVNPFHSGRPFSLSDKLIEIFDFNDKRRVHFVDSLFYNNKWVYLPYKYKEIGFFNLSSKERFVIIRLPSVYFNLIEAYYLNGNFDLAIKYLNVINDINYVYGKNINSIDLSIILNERYKEFFAESGDRWFTLKRLGVLDSVMSAYLPIKSNGMYTWNSEIMTDLPVPLFQEILNPYLRGK